LLPEKQLFVMPLLYQIVSGNEETKRILHKQAAAYLVAHCSERQLSLPYDQ
jgi:hypothetical protein